MMSQTLRLIAWVAAALLSPSQAPAFAAACGTGERERVQATGIDYQRILFTASTIDPADPHYAWQSLWGRIELHRGSLISSPDPALRQIIRYAPISYSTALLRSGHYLQFTEARSEDRTVTDIRLAAAPGLIDPHFPIGTMLTRPRLGTGPAISGYRFQMAEQMMGMAGSIGLWRRTGTRGPRTLLVLYSPRTDRRGEQDTRIIGRSDLAFSAISQTDSMHGGIWSFTLFTEAPCPQAVAMLTYRWVLYIPDLRR
jgi:hypothetical protein